MKNALFRKVSITATIIIILSLTLAPLVYADTSEKKCELSEITIDVFGINNVKPTQVTLTQQELKELKGLIDSFKERLDNAETIEETNVIFRETIVLLNEYGVLPKDMSIEETQALVSGGKILSYSGIISHDRVTSNVNKIFGNSNILCYIALNATNTKLFRINDVIFELYANAYYLPFFIKLFREVMGGKLYFLLNLPRFLLRIFNIHLREMISFGYSMFNPLPESYPSEGWVWTRGLLGKKNWSGTFFGGLDVLTRYGDLLPIPFFPPYIGVKGFTGMRITFSDESFFMGFATRVRIIPTE